MLARFWRPGGATKTALALELINLVAAARRDRLVHVVADRAYICKALRRLPANVTLTGPLPITPIVGSPPRPGRPAVHARPKGPPRSRGDRIGTPDQLAAAPGVAVSATRYGHTRTVTIYERRLPVVRGVRSQPVRVILIREPNRAD